MAARNDLKDARRLIGLSQAALAKLCGLAPADVSRIECGYRDVSLEEEVRLRAALRLPAPKGYVPKPIQPYRAAGMAAATRPHEPERAPPPVAAVNSAMPTPTQSVAAAQKPAAPKPAGNDLNDPTNFGQLPDPAVLDRGDLSPDAYRAKLKSTVDRANQILHTSRVPAGVWREWRAFERVVSEKLRVATVETPV